MALGQMWGRRRGHWPSKLKSGAWDRGISRDADPLWNKKNQPVIYSQLFVFILGPSCPVFL